MNKINFSWFLSIAGITWILAIICFCVEQYVMGKIFLIPSIISFVIKIWTTTGLFQYEINKKQFESIYHTLNIPIINF